MTTEYQVSMELTPQGLLLHVAGELYLETSTELGEVIRNTVSTGLYRRVIVDIRDIPIMDSSGIAALLKGKRATQESADYRVWVTLGSQPHRVLAAAGLIQHLGVCFDINLLPECE